MTREAQAATTAVQKMPAVDGRSCYQIEAFLVEAAFAEAGAAPARGEGRPDAGAGLQPDSQGSALQSAPQTQQAVHAICRLLSKSN
eukprot:6188184-Pleurochrysis_carterae.AAC.3